MPYMSFQLLHLCVDSPFIFPLGLLAEAGDELLIDQVQIICWFNNDNDGAK